MSKGNCVNTDGWKQGRENAIRTAKQKRLDNEIKYYANPVLCGCCKVVLCYDKRHHKFCSQRCNAIISNAGYNRHSGSTVLNRFCLCCNESLTGKSRYAKFCSCKCDNTYSKQQSRIQWETVDMFIPKMITSIGRGYYLDLHKYRCDECGWDKINPSTGKSPLNVEHVDGDCTNNRSDNIKVLCPSCHSLTPTYGSLNKGNSKRIKRYKATPV